MLDVNHVELAWQVLKDKLAWQCFNGSAGCRLGCGRSAETESVKARQVKRADAGGDDFIAVDGEVSSEKGQPADVGGLAYTMALFKVLVLWDGIPVDEYAIINLSIVEFSLWRC
jgi:hypothetical protein